MVVADKGNKTVIMDKDEYLKKVEDILQDKKLYQEVNDPTAKIKKKINNLTTQLLKKRKITEAQKRMLNSNENLATIKAQPKIHKDGNPMRIITCTRSTILSNITSFVFSLIKHLQDTINNNLSNTDQFISNIGKIKLEKEDRLSSLDVKDLFNSVPTTKAIGIALKRIEQSKKFKQSNFNKTDIKELLNLCTTNSYFTFNNKYYKQIKGLPMGSTISPLLADLYMDDFINTHFIDIKHRMYRYVDDILITTLAKSDLDSFVTEINSKRTSIKFTCEYEQNSSLNFLDTTVSRNILENKLETRWFRKETASDRLLHYESNHHRSMRVNVIKNMVRRIVSTTTNAKQQQEDLKQLKNMLLKSKYPKTIIEKTIQQSLLEKKQSTTINQRLEKTDPEQQLTLHLPYKNGMEVLKRKLEKVGVKLYFTYPIKLKSLTTTNIKPQPKSVVYQINCQCGAIYNGETKVGLSSRIKQHLAIIKINEKETPSELVKHHLETKGKCKFDPKKAFIISSETNYRKRHKKESIYSTINKSINKFDAIDESWNNVLHKETKSIKRTIENKRLHQETENKTISEGQDGNTGTDEKRMNRHSKRTSITVLSVPVLRERDQEENNQENLTTLSLQNNQALKKNVLRSKRQQDNKLSSSPSTKDNINNFTRINN